MATSVKPRPVVSIRVSEELEKYLKRLVTQWNVSRGVAAQRLLILGATSFEPTFYPVLEALSRLRGGADAFEFTCREMRTQLEKMRTTNDPLLMEAAAECGIRGAEFGILHATLEMHVQRVSKQAKEMRKQYEIAIARS